MHHKDGIILNMPIYAKPTGSPIYYSQQIRCDTDNDKPTKEARRPITNSYQTVIDKLSMTTLPKT